MDFNKLNSRFIRHVNVPSNLGTIEPPSGRALGVGQCGDSVEVTLKVIGKRISDIHYQPRGCAFTIACASTLSELAQNRTLENRRWKSPPRMWKPSWEACRKTICTARA